MAQQREQSKRNKQLMVNNFKGMETVVDSSSLGVDVADSAINISWDSDGGFSRREGTSLFHKSSSEINSFIKKSVNVINAEEIVGLADASQGDKFKEGPVITKDNYLITKPQKGKGLTMIEAESDGSGTSTIKDVFGNIIIDDNRDKLPQIENDTLKRLGITNDPDFLTYMYEDKFKKTQVAYVNTNGEYTNTELNVGVHDHSVGDNISSLIKDNISLEDYNIMWSAYDDKAKGLWMVIEDPYVKKAYLITPNVSFANKKELGKTSGDILSGNAGDYYSANTFCNFILLEDKIGNKDSKLIFCEKHGVESKMAIANIDGAFNTNDTLFINGLNLTRDIVYSNFYQDKIDNKVYFAAIIYGKYNDNSNDDITKATDPSEIYLMYADNIFGENSQVSFGGYKPFSIFANGSKTLLDLWKEKRRTNNKKHVPISISKDVNNDFNIAFIELAESNFDLERASNDGKKTKPSQTPPTSSGTVSSMPGSIQQAIDMINSGGFYDPLHPWYNHNRKRSYRTSASSNLNSERYVTNNVSLVVLNEASNTYTDSITLFKKIKSCKFKGLKDVGSELVTLTEDAFPKIFIDDKDNDVNEKVLYISANNGFNQVVDFSIGALEIKNESQIYAIKNDSAEDLEFSIYDKYWNLIKKMAIIHGSPAVDLDDTSRAKKAKYIIPHNSHKFNPYSMHDLKIITVSFKSSAHEVINNAMKLGNRVIGEQYDVLVNVYNDGSMNIINSNTGQQIQIVDADGISSIYQTKEDLTGKNIDWTYTNDSIFISTPESCYVITISKTKNTDGTFKYVSYINNIFDMADKITYNQAVSNGLNRLSDKPLEILKTGGELLGPSHSFEDIIITNDKKELALTIEPNTEYIINPQVIHIDTPGKQYSNEFTISLKLLNMTTNKWDEVASKISGTYPNIKMGGLDTNGEYRIDATVVIKDTSLSGTKDPDVTLKQSITFNVEGRSHRLNKEYESISDEIKKCKYITTIEGRLVFYGNGTRQIYTSEIDSPFYFTASEIVTADAFGKSEPIVSINTYKDTQIIFTRSTMMSMTRVYPEKGESFWSVLPLDGVIGTASHRSVTPIENSLAFVGDEGVYIIGQISVAEKRVQLIPIATPIQDVASAFITNNKDTAEKKMYRMEDINSANLEKRLIISYPTKKYTLVYDYNSAQDISKGKWSVWNGINPKQMIIDDFNLYFLHKTYAGENTEHLDNKSIYVKNKRQYLDLHELDVKKDYFTDNGQKYKVVYSSKNSVLGLPMIYKKIKRVSITSDNWYEDDAKYDVLITSDYQINWVYSIEGDSYKRANLKRKGFLKLGKAMTTWRKTENVKSITNMKSKRGLVISMSIINDSNEPFSIKRIYVEYIASNIKMFKHK